MAAAIPEQQFVDIETAAIPEATKRMAASDDDKEQEESCCDKKSKSSVEEETKTLLNYKELDDLMDQFDEQNEWRETPKEVLGVELDYESIKLEIYVTDSKCVAVTNFLEENNFTGIKNMEVIEAPLEDVGYNS